MRRTEHDLSDLQQAILLENDAVQRLREARTQLAQAVQAARGKGISYDHLARAALRAREGRAATLSARARETARLRQLHRRQNSRHAILPPDMLPPTLNELLSTSRKETTMSRLVKRRVVEETFEQDESDEDLNGADLDGDTEDETDDAEPAAPKRHPRR